MDGDLNERVLALGGDITSRRACSDYIIVNDVTRPGARNELAMVLTGGVPCILQLLHYWFINPGQWLPARFQEFAASTQMGVCFSPIPNRLPWLGESHPWCHQSPSCTPSLETTFLCWRDGLGLSFDVKHGFNVPNTNWIELKAKQCQCMFFFLTCRARQCQSGETRVLCTWPILMLHHWWGGVWRGSLG